MERESVLKPNRCSRCGAELPQGEPCRERFERCLTKDYEHPAEYGEVHHLVVVCYMLQHNEYSRDAWLEARKMLAQVIRQETSPAQLKNHYQRKFGGRRRQWNITKGAKINEVDGIVWTRTVADIRLDHADTYKADVQQWAASILTDSEPLIQKLEGQG